MEPQKKTLPAVKAIIKKGNKFLVLKQKSAGKIYWDLPGGKIQFNESPFKALKREVKEETNLSVTNAEPVGVYWFFRYADGNQVICTTFLCHTKNQNVRLDKNLKSSEDIIDYRWVTIKKFLNNTYKVSQDQGSLKKLLEPL